MNIRLLIPALVFVLASCSSAYRAQNNLKIADAREIKIDRAARLDQKTDPFTLKSAEQIGDILVLSVSYSGGCETHNFELITDGKYKSVYPPEIKVRLTHDNHNDGCRSMIDQKLYFNLTPLQYAGTNRVLLVIKNTDKTLEYNY